MRNFLVEPEKLYKFANLYNFRFFLSKTYSAVIIIFSSCQFVCLLFLIKSISMICSPGWL